MLLSKKGSAVASVLSAMGLAAGEAVDVAGAALTLHSVSRDSFSSWAEHVQGAACGSASSSSAFVVGGTTGGGCLPPRLIARVSCNNRSGAASKL